MVTLLSVLELVSFVKTCASSVLRLIQSFKILIGHLSACADHRKHLDSGRNGIFGWVGSQERSGFPLLSGARSTLAWHCNPAVQR